MECVASFIPWYPSLQERKTQLQLSSQVRKDWHRISPAAGNTGALRLWEERQVSVLYRHWAVPRTGLGTRHRHTHTQRCACTPPPMRPLGMKLSRCRWTIRPWEPRDSS